MSWGFCENAYVKVVTIAADRAAKWLKNEANSDCVRITWQ
ncbi:hypothetical protein CEV33_2108 [Brucella grignonensis]|uniref:Uncharacterized protein n=1 Tax=Brucella grignonensis TaxID=94627 RepID=A0A256F7G3_9HYPH|nr:hypothetical protein CEV33_2108 [Brucella grignonensis]